MLSQADTSRVAGHAVLYEAVVAVTQVVSDQALRAQAVDLLGKFLASKENNLR